MSTVADPEAGTGTALEDYVKSRGGNLPIKKVLIANNGMAATKSILSMRQWVHVAIEIFQWAKGLCYFCANFQ